MDFIVEDKLLVLKNLQKLYFESLNIKKAEVIDYYIQIAPLLLPHLIDRPFSMIFFPEGENVDRSFFQKQRPSDAPNWLNSVKIPSKKREYIDWCMVNDLPSLIYMVNKSVMEMHAWFSKAQDLRKPDIAAIDIDPSGNTGFSDAVIIANAFKVILDEFKLYSVPKTSGSRGIHIFIPIEPKYDFDEVQQFLKLISAFVLKAHPNLATTERTKAKRGDRVYLDAVQCAYGKTLAMPYSLRVKSGALVSCPLFWDEVDKNLNPKDFNINTMQKRLQKAGDLMGDFYSRKQELPLLH